jgi:hypothetical protein
MPRGRTSFSPRKAISFENPRMLTVSVDDAASFRLRLEKAGDDALECY